MIYLDHQDVLARTGSCRWNRPYFANCLCGPCFLLSDLTPAKQGKAAVISVACSSQAHWRSKLTAAFDIGQPRPSQMEETSTQKVWDAPQHQEGPKWAESSNSNKNAPQEKGTSCRCEVSRALILILEKLEKMLRYCIQKPRTAYCGKGRKNEP